MAGIWRFFLSFLLFVVVCAGGLFWFVDHEVEKALNNAVTEVDGLTLAYTNVSVNLLDRNVTVEKPDAVLPDGRRLTADQLIIHTFDERNPVPHFMKVEALGLTVLPLDAEAGGRFDPVGALGVETLHGDALLDYSYDQTAQTLTVKSLSFNEDTLGDLSLSGNFDRLDLGALRMEKLLGLRIADLNLRFTNGTFVDTVFTSVATRLGVSEIQARKQFCAELKGMADSARKTENTVAEEVLLGVRRFVADPGVIAISARPKKPVPYLYFFMGRDIYENLQLMNVTVTTDSSDHI